MLSFKEWAAEVDRGERNGLLAGLPISLKDQYTVKVRQLNYIHFI